MDRRHFAQYLATTPLLLDPVAEEQLIAALMGGERFEPQEVLSHMEGSTKVIEIHGPLSNHGSWIHEWLGLPTYDDIRTALKSGLTDAAVSEIILDVDSPGGEAAGAFDLADEIFEGRSVKPIRSFSERATSAGYLLASAASEHVASQTAAEGSIGVIISHVEWSEADKLRGIKRTVITSGARKADGHPGFPLSPEARTALQGQVDELYRIFASCIERFRGIPRSAIDALQAGVFIGAQALEHNLIDRVGTRESMTVSPATTTYGGPSMTTENAEATGAAPPAISEADLQTAVDTARAEGAADAVGIERTRVAGLEAAALGKPHLSALLAKAKAGDTTVEQFKIAAFDVKPSAGAEYLDAAADDSVAPVAAANADQAAAQGAADELPPKERAEALFKGCGEIRAEFGTPEILAEHLRKGGEV